MSNFFRGLLLTISIISVLVAGTACSSGEVRRGEETPAPSNRNGSSVAPTNGAIQSYDGGNVIVDVEWIKAEGGLLVFNVTMNTHSVNLDGYDLGELSVLRDDKGNEYQPVSWNPAGGGHHTQGTLTFPIPDSVKQGQAGYFEIVIRDIAGIEARVLKWEL